MAISAFKGPVVSFGAEPQADSNDLEGPDTNNAGSMQQDPRAYTTYAGGNWVAGWYLAGRGLLTVDALPCTANATCIAATQSSATAIVLASANNSSSQVVVNAQAINVNTGALLTGLVAISCPNATATNQFLAFGRGGTNGVTGINVWDPANAAARILTVTAAGTDSGRTVTISGNDFYGVPVTQVVSVLNTSAAATTKAFKYIRSATLDALPTGGVSIGIGTGFGLPIRADSLVYVDARNLNTAVTALTAAVTTDPATTATGDVRGTLASAASNTRLAIYQTIPTQQMLALTTGTNSGILGVDQV